MIFNLVYLNVSYVQAFLIIGIGILGKIGAQFLFLYITYFNNSLESVYCIMKSRWMSI